MCWSKNEERASLLIYGFIHLYIQKLLRAETLYCEINWISVMPIIMAMQQANTSWACDIGPGELDDVNWPERANSHPTFSWGRGKVSSITCWSWDFYSRMPFHSPISKEAYMSKKLYACYTKISLLFVKKIRGGSFMCQMKFVYRTSCILDPEPNQVEGHKLAEGFSPRVPQLRFKPMTLCLF